MSDVGHIIGGPVDPDYDGAVLTADLAVGDTVLHVDDPADFDEDAVERDARLIVGMDLDGDQNPDATTGTFLPYLTYDDDAGTVILASPSTVAAASGDPVYIENPVSGLPAGRVTVMVAIDDSDTTGDALPAYLDVSLLESVGDYDLYDLAVDLEEDEDGQLYVAGFPGLTKRQGGVKFMQDQVTALGPGDLTLPLTYRPIENSEHLYWQGVYQDGAQWSRDGWTVTIPDSGDLIKAGDTFVMEYAYSDLTTRPIVPASVELIAAMNIAVDNPDRIIPDGVEVGDYFVFAGSHGASFGSASVGIADDEPRKIDERGGDYITEHPWPDGLFVGFGRLTDLDMTDGSGHPIVKIICSASDNSAGGSLAFYRIVGNVSWQFSTGDGGSDVTSPTPCRPDGGSEGAAHIVAVTGPPSIDQPLVMETAGWTQDHVNGTYGGEWHQEGSAPLAHVIRVGADFGEWRALWLMVSDA